MRRIVLLSISSLLLTSTFAGFLWAEGSKPRAGKLELVLHYDFLPDQAARVRDASGKKHDGVIRGGEIVEGRRKHAVKLDGTGAIAMSGVPSSLDPSSRPLTVGAFCQPSAPDGVVVAMGDREGGFSLYLKEGLPRFAVRSHGKLWKVAAAEPVVMDQWVHLAGTIDVAGRITLVVNGWPVATTQAELIAHRPTAPFCAGQDPGSHIGEYTSPLGWHGLLQDIRMYWGAAQRTVDAEVWQDWADRPGCGCGKR